MATPHKVAAEDLRRLATIDKHSLFRDATALVDTEDGIEQVTWNVVAAVLEGKSTLRYCRLLYSREQFTEDGVITGAKPRSADKNISLDERLTSIASGINSGLPGSHHTDEEAAP